MSAADFEPCEADTYFIYDFGTDKAVEKILFDLRRLSLRRSLRLVARGRHCRYLIKRRHSWLEAIDDPSGEAPFTIYRSLHPEIEAALGVA